MNILIIGGKGMLGSMLTNTLQENHNVTSWDRDEIDISQEREVEKKIGQQKVDIIINAAAFTAVDDCEVKQDIAMQVNGTAVGYLAKQAAKLDIPIVHYSTDYVFDGHKKEGYNENDHPDPLSMYGKSKYQGEQELRKNCKKFYLIRTSWLYGPNGKNWVDTMVHLAKTKDKLSIVNDQHGKPTYTKDLAATTKTIIEGKKDYGIYHVTNEGETTWYDFGKAIFALKKLPIPVSTTTTAEFFQNRPYFAQRPEYSSLNNTKLPQLRSWQEAVKE